MYRYTPREPCSAETGSRNMAETTGMNFSTPTSYSTSYSLGGLSRLFMTFCRWNFQHYAIIQTFRLGNFFPQAEATPTSRSHDHDFLYGPFTLYTSICSRLAPNTLLTVSRKPEVVLLRPICPQMTSKPVYGSRGAFATFNVANLRDGIALAPKPEEEIWRKPREWTFWPPLPIRPPIHYGVYLDSVWPFVDETFNITPLYRRSDFAIFAHKLKPPPRLPIRPFYDQ